MVFRTCGQQDRKATTWGAERGTSHSPAQPPGVHSGCFPKSGTARRGAAGLEEVGKWLAIVVCGRRAEQRAELVASVLLGTVCVAPARSCGSLARVPGLPRAAARVPEALLCQGSGLSPEPPSLSRSGGERADLT